MRVKRKLFLTTAFAALLGVGAFAGVALTKDSAKPAEVEAADYSSTIRVYLDFNTSGWGTITDIRIGGNGSGNNVVLSSSNAKYNQSLGNYVKDISSGNTYDKMGCFFKENGTQWEYQYDGGYIWIDDSKFQPGYEFQIKGIGWVADSGSKKLFKAEVYRIGEIRDNAQNSTFYFVDGYSWHVSKSVTAYFWGGTASAGSYPGKTMSDSSLRLKAFVGETEFSGLYIMQYTLSGSAAYVKFSNNNGGQETGDLVLTDGGIYFYGVSDTSRPVIELLISLKSKLGSYSYGGKNFSQSICHLSQTDASSFVSTYDNLVSTGGSGIASSVAGSGLVTYDTPETSSTHTAEVSLLEIRSQLIKKYPSISALGRIGIFTSITENTFSFIIVIVISATSLAAIGGYFLFKKKKEN